MSKIIKIITWNVNSIAMRAEHLQMLIQKHNPDIILLQEIKCLSEKFPYSMLDHYGYNIEVFGQKAYNGVAILSKYRLEDITLKISNYTEMTEARYIQCFIAVNNIALNVASIYVPNGGEVQSEKFRYKLEFLDKLKLHISNLKAQDCQILIGGDFNVANENIDVYNPQAMDGSTCFHIEERIRFRKILNDGMIDLFRISNPDQQSFSWWDYRAGCWPQNKGMRLDYLLSTPKICDLLKCTEIDSSFRALEKASDHAPVIASLQVW